MARTSRTDRSIPAATPACHVVANGVELSPRVRAIIRREAARLTRFFDRILEIRVTVTCPHRRPRREAVQYNVVIRITVPLTDLVVKRQQSPDLLTAVQASFKAAGRLLQDRARRYRGAPAPREGAPTGIVARVFPFEGYGFLVDEAGEELYFHRNSVVDGALEGLEPGDRVRYAAAEGREGPQASTVIPARPRRSARPRRGPAAGPRTGSSRG